MQSWQAAVLGVVEGITEYLPVSSTGHLLLAERLMNIPRTSAADSFAIAIQLGAILAILAVYGSRVSQMAKGLVGRDDEGRNLALNVLVAFVPAAVAGFLAGDFIKTYLFNLNIVAGAWALWGLAILVIFMNPRFCDPSIGQPLETLTWRGALTIGLFQLLALVPGTSRSLVTIIGALVVGLSLPSAVEFSFLLGVVTLGAATVWDLTSHFGELTAEFGWEPLLIGMIVSFVSALGAVKWMVYYLSRHGMRIFGWYRLGIAALTIALVAAGFIGK
ncbi:MAG TPA: undecaprenyl-diphosphate phosphatase [Myxococcota bacterium]|nr:undecaprenyl-diphosphate phosphatase [Myxococcota bacterium]